MYNIQFQTLESSVFASAVFCPLVTAWLCRRTFPVQTYIYIHDINLDVTLCNYCDLENNYKLLFFILHYNSYPHFFPRLLFN